MIRSGTYQANPTRLDDIQLRPILVHSTEDTTQTEWPYRGIEGIRLDEQA